MASVFLAWDHKLKVWRAVKILLPSAMTKKKVRKRFENEAHAMARLEHPNIIRVYDVGAEDGIPYMVMELAEGGSIIDWLQNHGSMPPRLAVDVTVQVCKGIRAAHDSGIVHRDIKPHNVLVNSRGQCKVTDFGIAQVMDIDTLTKTGSVMGTWGYMAPEQRTDAKNVDERADVFSIGATLYTLLTKKTPTELYVADEDDEIFDGIPPELLEVILMACRYKPATRYPDVKSLGMAVYKAGTTQPQVPPDTPNLVLNHEALPDSIESALLSPTIVEDLNAALGRKQDTTAPDDDTGIEEAATPVPVSPPKPPPKPPEQTDPSKILPYYMPSKPAGQATPGGLHRRGRADAYRPSGIPSYIDESEYQRQNSEERVPAPSPEPAPPTTAEEPLEAGAAPDLLIPVVILGVLLLLGAVGVLAYGTVTVNGAASEASSKARVLYAKLSQPGPIVDALVAAGASRSPMETAYAEFAEARGTVRGEAAMQFVHALEASAEGLEVPGPVSAELAAMGEARDTYREAREAWSESGETLTGGLAVSVGLTRVP